MSIASAIKRRQRISTLLFAVFAAIAALVLLGVVATTLRLVEIRGDLGDLRDSALPRLIKLSQLSQEAAATISIAPALSAQPTRFEFETLLSRIKDKETSQKELIGELDALIENEEAAGILRRNGDLLMENLGTLTDVVSAQIAVRKSLETHIEFFRRIARGPSEASADSAESPGGGFGVTQELARLAAHAILNALLDPNSARLSRNRSEIDIAMARLERARGTNTSDRPAANGESPGAADELARYWSREGATIIANKQAELSNEFKIKALVEENSLIANRLLASANSEFWRANTELQTHIAAAETTTRFMLISIVIVVAAFAAGNVVIWYVLKRRVFVRLDRMSQALRAFADNRERPTADDSPDEIGEISDSLMHYMAVIDAREAELAEKTQMLEQLSNQLAKYLSPQVYDSIFSGRQEVKVASSRKKLTIFFSDIAGFTETADRLESEELSQLLNHDLTEMSEIALAHGATIDKYVGDAILIFFGDPDTRGVKEDALACVKMAIAMRERMHDLADIWRKSGIEKPLKVRMGIHTGFCTVGNFGSEDRLDYTIIGGSVNTASRLESLATPGEILISYETFALVQDEIQCEEHGEIEIKGIAYPVATYRVLEYQEELDRHLRHFDKDMPNMKLDLDLAGMTPDERARAARTLRRALRMLENDEAPKPARIMVSKEGNGP